MVQLSKKIIHIYGMLVEVDGTALGLAIPGLGEGLAPDDPLVVGTVFGEGLC